MGDVPGTIQAAEDALLNHTDLCPHAAYDLIEETENKTVVQFA
jgi:hypothetical protein